jgi:hypothetical protein
MHSPSAALGWEIWRRHRPRLIAIIGMLLGFALVYPRLCALAGFNPDSADAGDEFARKLVPIANGGPTLLWICQLLGLLFLVGGPATAMLLSLLCVTWMFTFIEFNPNAKDPVTFSSRVFTLPISTSYLYWRLLLGGVGAIVVLFESWIHLVRQPHLEIFGEYQDCFGWITLVVLAQGIVWALAGWPSTRLLVLTGVLFFFLFSRAWGGIFESPFVLPTLFLLGAVLARISLQKMRHGQWQGWTWKRPLPAMFAPAELRGPKRFFSPAQAQLWFEWRRFARPLCIMVVALTVVPVVTHLLVRVAVGGAPLQNDTLFAFTVILVVIPPVLHFLSSMSPDRTHQSFLMVRPMTDGVISMTYLKAAAISTAISWAAVFVALGGMHFLGDFRAVERSVSVLPECRAAIVIGLIFVTWRMFAVNHCFARSGNRSLAGVPVLMFLALYFGLIIFSAVLHSDYCQDRLSRFVPFVPGLLASLIAIKLLVAFIGFRICLKRKLFAPSAMAGCLTVWILLVAMLLALEWILPRPSKELILPLALGAVLLVPLARIAFGPIALAHSRHN